MPSNNSDNYNNSTSSTPEDERAQEKAAQQEAANKAAKTIAKGAATYYGGEAGGAAVDALAKTKLGQAAINQGGKALNNMPGIGKAAKQLDDAGVIDMADKAIGNAAKEGTLGPKDMPSNQNTPDSLNALPKPNGSSLLDDDKNEKETDLTGTGTGSFDLKKVVIPMAVLFSPFLLVILLVFAIASNLSIFFDAYGISQASGGPTGGDVYYEENGDAQAFYVRVNEVKLGYEKSGKYVDALKVVSVYHIISQYNGNITYNEMKKRQIEQIADAMFDGNTYSDEVFKQNLTNTIFKSIFQNILKKKDKD